MKKDFTLSIYQELLSSLVSVGYDFQTYNDFTSRPKNSVILLRHDVDDRPENSLKFAQIQHEMGIVGTYYFRMVPQSFHVDVIREIASLGHEIGYHYEDMDFANGDVDKAYELAKKHLSQLREVVEVKTICMHGSPRSPYDNKEVWEKYDYRDLGIIAEPYFDLDFSKVLYVTDTGRRWDGGKVSIRDKVSLKSEHSNSKLKNLKTKPGSPSLSDRYSFRTTLDIIEACKTGNLPDQIMFNFHPQRWTNNPVEWSRELVWQNMKNVIKWGIVKWVRE